MNSSLRKAKTRQVPDFGTYHHTTPSDSRKIRGLVRSIFLDAFASLPFHRDDELKILDVGCGLGFLSCISAEFYRKSRIKGFDTFEHDSLKGSSLSRARENARILGFSDRINFDIRDVFTFTPNESYDIFVSNPVYHNLGRKRFEAYSRLSSWAKTGSFVLMGDLFSSLKTDLSKLSKDFRLQNEFDSKEKGFRAYHLLVLSRKDSK
jgi:trans-aconitate methyltransferase